MGETVGVAAGTDVAVSCSTLGALSSESPHAVNSTPAIASTHRMSTSGNHAAVLFNRGTPAFYESSDDPELAAVWQPRLLVQLRLEIALDADVGDHPLLSLNPVEVLFLAFQQML